MFGLGRGVTLALVGWLWADILLALFIIFLAASSVPASAAQADPGLDPTPLQLTVPVNGQILLAGDASAVAAERDRFAAAVEEQLRSRGEGRRVAILFAFGSQGDPVKGDLLARSATDGLTSTRFSGAVVKAYHDIVAGDPGTAVSLEIYFHR